MDGMSAFREGSYTHAYLRHERNGIGFSVDRVAVIASAKRAWASASMWTENGDKRAHSRSALTEAKRGAELLSDGYDAVMAANLIYRLPKPRKFLEVLVAHRGFCDLSC